MGANLVELNLLGGLRERAAVYGLEALSESDVLELFLTRSLKSGAKTWAQVLLGTWQSLAGVLGADVEDLRAVVGREAAVDLKLLHEATLRVLAGSIRNRDVLSSSTALQAYLRVKLAERTREQFRVLFLDKRNQLISDELMGQGTTDHAPVYPREVVRRAIQLDACALVLVHNHPSGDPSPSHADIKMTQEVVAACAPLRIVVHDHLLIAGQTVVSFKALGLF